NVFKGTPKDCYSCHQSKDTHQGILGQNCAECHNTNGWKQALYNRPHTFPRNHEGARTCKQCHTTSLASYSCYGCHSQTSVQREHRDISNYQDCVRCHPTGRKP
ncbi:MAG: hypothetical protein HY670_01770, partial [Chloroflexi bacterium]|nr:hypothetical protein [Chloroflexota bacterium]